MIDRIGPWLPVLRALTANSPYWQGRDTGYASYRTEVWGRWPSAGPTEQFGSAAAYDATWRPRWRPGPCSTPGWSTSTLGSTASSPPWRSGSPTSCSTSVVFAALARALVRTAARAWHDGLAPTVPRTEVLKLAHRQAAHTGLDGDLVDPRTARPAPARVVLDALCGHVRDALGEAGDVELVRDGVARVFREGTGARVQRETARYHGDDLRAVVTDAVGRTRR